MILILRDFARAVAQLTDRRFARVLWLGLALTLALLVAAHAAFLWFVQWIGPDAVTIPGVGEVTWIGDLLGWGSLLFMLVLSVFLMVPVASAITSFFLDDVAAAVEAEWYPRLPPAPRTGLVEGLRDTLGFLGLVIGANAVALILFVFFPPAGPFLFYGVNGYLLGREYFQLAAMRREGREGARELRRRHAGTIWVAGLLMVVPLSVPVVNLLVPVLGAATFTHLYHRLAGR